MARSYQELLALIATEDGLQAEAFEVLGDISSLGLDDRNSARDLVIRILDKRASLPLALQAFLNDLVREHGLFPYLLGPQNLSLADQVAMAAHRPKGDSSTRVFHSEQAAVYHRLMAGESVILSAPTSFGKSLLVDAVIRDRDFKNVVVIVPTIALMDETRRRLMLAGLPYKVITHRSQSISERNIFVMTQERYGELVDPPRPDFFVVDEFYKLSPNTGDARVESLNVVFQKLWASGSQSYLLGPNVANLAAELPAELRATFTRSEFSTVAADFEVVRVDEEHSVAEAVRRAQPQNGPTLIYCNTPARVAEVAAALVAARVPTSPAEGAADWLGITYHPDWLVAKSLRYGVGMHHARLPRAIGHHVVRLFNEGRLDTLVATSTLIEGVNTNARQVIVLDKKIGRRALDYFTFGNIIGRAGRMLKHFVGHIVLLNPAPPRVDLTVDIPSLSQSDLSTPEMLIQLPSASLTSGSLGALRDYLDQDVLSLETLQTNRGAKLDDQLALARVIRDAPKEWISNLSWTAGTPTANQLKPLGDSLLLLAGGTDSAVKTGKQLIGRLNILRHHRGDPRAVAAQAIEEGKSVDVAFDEAFEFSRNWAQFKIPTALRALAVVANDVLSRRGQVVPVPTAFASAIENSFLPPFVSALEEFGLPAPVSIALRRELGLAGANSLDDVLENLRRIHLSDGRLHEFEIEMLEDVLTGIGVRWAGN